MVEVHHNRSEQIRQGIDHQRCGLRPTRQQDTAFAAEGACAQGVNAAARAVGETALIVQLQPGVQPDGLISALRGLAGSATVVDPSSLLSPQGTEAACMWWDECGPNGLVTIRADDTTLTPVGAQRVARALTAILS